MCSLSPRDFLSCASYLVPTWATWCGPATIPSSKVAKIRYNPKCDRSNHLDQKGYGKPHWYCTSECVDDSVCMWLQHMVLHHVASKKQHICIHVYVYIYIQYLTTVCSTRITPHLWENTPAPLSNALRIPFTSSVSKGHHRQTDYCWLRTIPWGQNWWRNGYNNGIDSIDIIYQINKLTYIV